MFIYPNNVQLKISLYLYVNGRTHYLNNKDHRIWIIQGIIDSTDICKCLFVAKTVVPGRSKLMYAETAGA